MPTKAYLEVMLVLSDRNIKILEEHVATLKSIIASQERELGMYAWQERRMSENFNRLARHIAQVIDEPVPVLLDVIQH